MARPYLKSAVLLLCLTTGAGAWWWATTSGPEPVAPARTLPSDWSGELQAARDHARLARVALMLRLQPSESFGIRFTGSSEDVLEKEVFMDLAVRDALAPTFHIVDLFYDPERLLPGEQEYYAAIAVSTFDTRLQGEHRRRTLPYVLLADANGWPFATAPKCRTGERDAWLAATIELTAVRDQRDANLAAAAQATGPARAKALARALDAMSEDVVSAFYQDQMREIIALDGDGAAGLRERFHRLLQWGEAAPVFWRLHSIFNEFFTDAMNGHDVQGLRADVDKVTRAHPDNVLLQPVGRAYGAWEFMNRDPERAVRELEAARALDPDGRAVPMIDGWLRDLRERRGRDGSGGKK